MKIFIYCLMILLFSLSLISAKSVYLKELIKPSSMKVDGDVLYIMDGAKILTYSLKDYTLIKSFGKEGEGPGEISNPPFWSNQVSIFGDNLFLEGFLKYMIVKNNGKLILDKRKVKRFIKILPVGKNYIVRTFPLSGDGKKSYSLIKIIGPDMEDIKVLLKINEDFLKGGANNFHLIPDSVNFCVYKRKIYLEDSRKGFLVKVFNQTGEKLYKIKKEIPKIKVTKEILKQEMEILKESFKQKRFSIIIPMHISESGWDRFSKWVKFIEPEYLPTIKNIIVKSDRIYLQTYFKKGDKEEYFILDLEGNILKRMFLPQLKSFALYQSILMGTGMRYYDFSKDSFYYLEEDEEKEMWKLIKVLY